MKSQVKKKITNNYVEMKVSLDIMQFYLSNNVKLHPLVYTHFITSLKDLQLRGKVSLIPVTILQIFDNKFKKLHN